jgi:short-subunit dehydrogenase
METRGHRRRSYAGVQSSSRGTIMTEHRTTALVTGASSGIGEELARVHAEHGGDLVIVARRRDRLEAMKAELEKTHGITVYVLAQDLTQTDAPRRIFDELQSRGVAVDILINNAGLGYLGLFNEQDWSRNEDMIKINILALAALTRLFLPPMIERRSGRVLNIASMAGFVPGPNHAVYYASKAFVISLSEAIANELEGTGVTVTVLCPGPVDTEFTRRSEMKGVRLLKHKASARDTAQAGYNAMLKGKTVVVPGPVSKLTIHGLLRLSPRWLTTRISRALMEKK